MSTGWKECPIERRLRIFLAVFLGLHALFLIWNFAPALSAPDDNGYFTQGSLLATTGKTWFTPESPAQYVGVHWLLTPGDRYYSRHSPGLAVPVAVISLLLGPEAGVALNAALAVLGVLGCFLLARCVLRDRWALAAAVLLAVNPSYTAHAIVCDAHMAVTVLLVWGLCFLQRWATGGRRADAFIAGLLLGCIPAVRAPEAIYAAGIIALLLMYARSRPSWPVALVGAAIPVGALMAYNHLSFGAFWRTAYSFTGEQSGFGLHHLADHFFRYIRDLLSIDGVGLFLVLGAAGAVVMCTRAHKRATGLAFLLLMVPTMILYMSYYWAPQGPPVLTVRFLLPTFPLYFIAGLWLVSLIETARPRRAIALAVIGLQLLWAGPGKTFFQTRFLHHQKRLIATAAAGLDAQVERGSVVMARPMLLQHLDFLRRWRLADPVVTMSLPLLEGFEQQISHARAHVLQPAKLEARAAPYRGLGLDELERAFADDVLAWADGAPVYFIGTASDIDEMPGVWLHPENFEVVARVPMPETPPAVERTKVFLKKRLVLRRAREQRSRHVDDGPRPADESEPAVPGALTWIAGGRGEPPEADLLRFFGLFSGAEEMVIARWTPLRREPLQEPDPIMWQELW